jgi:hypothetical protein
MDSLDVNTVFSGVMAAARNSGLSSPVTPTPKGKAPTQPRPSRSARGSPDATACSRARDATAHSRARDAGESPDSLDDSPTDYRNTQVPFSLRSSFLTPRGALIGCSQLHDIAQTAFKRTHRRTSMFRSPAGAPATVAKELPEVSDVPPASSSDSPYPESGRKPSFDPFEEMSPKPVEPRFMAI